MPSQSKLLFLLIVRKKYESKLQSLKYSAAINFANLRIKYKNNLLGGFICTISINAAVFGKALKSTKLEARLTATRKAMGNLAKIYPTLEINSPYSLTYAIEIGDDKNVRRFLLKQMDDFLQNPTKDAIAFNISEYEADDLSFLSHLTSDLEFHSYSKQGKFIVWRHIDYIAVYYYLKEGNRSYKYELSEPQ